jgi:Transcriptional regulator
MIEFNQLKQLICIAENKTLSNAAQKLFISQPALSRSMQRLEEDLQVQLFDHYKNKIVLNQNGELVVKHAKKILKDMDKMIENVQKFDKSMHSLSLFSCAPAPLWNIEELIKKIYPSLLFQSKIADQEYLVQNLKDQEIDCIITSFEIKDENILCIPYIKEDLYLSLPSTHRLKEKQSVTFSDLKGETMLLYAHIGFWYHMHIQTMKQTTFLIQNERTTFQEIIKASTLPSFITNLSIKKEGIPENRIIIPFDEQDAHVTFYFSILKKNKNKMIKLIQKIQEKKEDEQ